MTFIPNTDVVVLTRKELDELVASQGEQPRVSRRELAELQGVSLSTLSESPWLVPDFGNGIKGKRGYKWRESVVLKWLRIPVEERKRLFKEEQNERKCKDIEGLSEFTHEDRY